METYIGNKRDKLERYKSGRQIFHCAPVEEPVPTQQPLPVMSNGMVGCVVWADSHEYTAWALNCTHTPIATHHLLTVPV